MDDALLPVVQKDVLPCLYVKYGPASRQANGRKLDDGPHTPLTAEDLSRFVDALLASETDRAWEFLNEIKARGASAEWVVVELFAAAACALGERWEEDLSDFSEVTIAMSHLGGLLRRISADFIVSGQRMRSQCRMLLAPAPGEQHSFGLSVVTEFFLRAGFELQTFSSSTYEILMDAVRAEHYDAVGLSMGATIHKDSLTESIRRLRSASRNRALAIVVGGAGFDRDPQLCRQVGADMHVTDIREGPVRVMKLIRLLARRYGRS